MLMGAQGAATSDVVPFSLSPFPLYFEACGLVAEKALSMATGGSSR